MRYEGRLPDLTGENVALMFLVSRTVTIYGFSIAHKFVHRENNKAGVCRPFMTTIIRRFSASVPA